MDLIKKKKKSDPIMIQHGVRLIKKDMDYLHEFCGRTGSTTTVSQLVRLAVSSAVKQIKLQYGKPSDWK